MTKNTRFSPEVRQRAVRMVLESEHEYPSQWAALQSIAQKIGCTPVPLKPCASGCVTMSRRPERVMAGLMPPSVGV
ncbi:Uncharacterised protein [Morganella morganii]|nr:Uncharacterised protein [Morganella morganii]